MATAVRFEDLRCWQTGRQLANLVYDSSEEGAFANDLSLKDQIRRAAVSIMSNIAEGFNSRTQGVFIDLLGRARGSASEVQAQLYVALDRGYVCTDQFKEAYALADKASREMYRFIQYLESRTDNDRIQETPVQYDVSDDLLGDTSDA